MSGVIAILFAFPFLALTVALSSLGLSLLFVHGVLWLAGKAVLVLLDADVDMANLLSATIALVVALFAVCVTVYIFLFSELMRGGPRPAGVSRVSASLQGRHRDNLTTILILVFAAIIVDYLGILLVDDKSGESGSEPCLDAISLVLVVLSIALCVYMLCFCKRAVDFRAELVKIAERELKSALDSWEEEETAGGGGRQVRWSVSNRDAKDGTNRSDLRSLRNVERALRGILDQIDDGKMENAVQDGGRGDFRKWTRQRELFFRYEEARDAHKLLSVDNEPKKTDDSRVDEVVSSLNGRALSLCDKLWKRVLASEGEALEPLRQQQIKVLDLSEIDFRKAQARGTRFESCNLSKANFTDANLQYGEIKDCTLAGADLSGADCRFLAFRNCDMSRMTLMGSDKDAGGSSEGRIGASGERLLPVVFSPETSMQGASFDDSLLVDACLALDRDISVDRTEKCSRGGDGSPQKGFSFEGCSFRRVSFRDSEATNIRMARSIWDGSSLSRATLQDCDMHSASLVGAALAGVRIRNGILSGATLTEAYFGDSHLKECDMSLATLDKCVFEGGEIEDCDLNRAGMDGLRIVKVAVKGGKFSYARGHAVRFIEATLSECSFDHCFGNGWAYLGATIQNGTFEGCRLDGASLSGSTVESCCFSAAVLSSAAFDGVTFQGKIDFDDVDLGDTTFVSAKFLQNPESEQDINPGSGSNLQNVTTFSSCDCARANFAMAKLESVSFTACDLSNANFKSSYLEFCIFVGADLSGVDFENAVVRNTTFSGVENVQLLDDALQKAKTASNVTINGEAFRKNEMPESDPSAT